MYIHGINKLTLLDFPEHTACTLFTGGCNFRCPFCQNGGLVLSPRTEPVIDEGWLFGFLKKRRNVLQGVCITGGEPTIQGDLAAFICRVRELGYKIKLDTNGYRPDVLSRLLEEGLLDAVAMDIKSSPENYARVCGLDRCSDHADRDGAERRACSQALFEGCGGHADKAGTGTGDDCGGGQAQKSTDARFKFGNIDQSTAILAEYGRLHSEFYYEFRTTLVREMHTPEDMRSIGNWLAGAPRYYLQHYEDSEYVIAQGLTAYSGDEMQEMADIVREYIPNVQIRGI